MNGSHEALSVRIETIMNCIVWKIRHYCTSKDFFKSQMGFFFVGLSKVYLHEMKMGSCEDESADFPIRLLGKASPDVKQAKANLIYDWRKIFEHHLSNFELLLFLRVTKVEAIKNAFEVSFEGRFH